MKPDYKYNVRYKKRKINKDIYPLKTGSIDPFMTEKGSAILKRYFSRDITKDGGISFSSYNQQVLISALENGLEDESNNLEEALSAVKIAVESIKGKEFISPDYDFRKTEYPLKEVRFKSYLFLLRILNRDKCFNKSVDDSIALTVLGTDYFGRYEALFKVKESEEGKKLHDQWMNQVRQFLVVLEEDPYIQETRMEMIRDKSLSE